MRSVLLSSVSVALLCMCASAQQESDRAVTIPATLSGDAMYNHTSPPGEGYRKDAASAGLRAVIAPTWSMGEHWFAYAALDAHTSSYFSYKSGLERGADVEFNLMQAFLGYTITKGRMTLLVKGGQLSSAFGSFPVEYDEAKTAFPNPPPSYMTPLPLRPDQHPCGVKDLLAQDYAGKIDFHCGGSTADAYGILPVTLYGLPGIEAQVSAGRFDGRVQVTNSSPANPKALWAANQSAQWTAGGGYTSKFGLRVGTSTFRGAWLDTMPNFRNFPATAVGIDAQWALGRWSLEGEWQTFRFALPLFVQPLTERAAYAQVKAILTPRTFVAVRFTTLNFGHVQDASGVTAGTYTDAQQVYEVAFGYRPNRYQILKTGFAWTDRNDWRELGWYWPQQKTTGAQIQLVTTLPTFSRALR